MRWLIGSAAAVIVAAIALPAQAQYFGGYPGRGVGMGFGEGLAPGYGYVIGGHGYGGMGYGGYGGPGMGYGGMGDGGYGGMGMGYGGMSGYGLGMEYGTPYGGAMGGYGGMGMGYGGMGMGYGGMPYGGGMGGPGGYGMPYGGPGGMGGAPPGAGGQNQQVQSVAGTVVAVNRSSLLFQNQAGQQDQFLLTPQTQVVSQNGQVVPPNQVQPGTEGRVAFERQGNELVATSIQLGAQGQEQQGEGQGQGQQ